MLNFPGSLSSCNQKAVIGMNKMLKKRVLIVEDEPDLSAVFVNLLDVFEEKAIVLFSLDSLKNRNVTQMMGRLIVKDVNTAVSLRIDTKSSII